MPRKSGMIAMAQQNFLSIWFDPQGVSRYSDGTFNILYTATERECAETERCYWAVECFLKSGTVSDLKGFFMYTCDITGRHTDYTKNWRKNKKLVHPTNYTYCHQLGHRALTRGVDYLLVPSARKFRGHCIPVFKQGSGRVKRVVDAFDFGWDAKAQKAFIKKGKVRRYVTIDDVYARL